MKIFCFTHHDATYCLQWETKQFETLGKKSVSYNNFLANLWCIKKCSYPLLALFNVAPLRSWFFVQKEVAGEMFLREDTGQGNNWLTYTKMPFEMKVSQNFCPLLYLPVETFFGLVTHFLCEERTQRMSAEGATWHYWLLSAWQIRKCLLLLLLVMNCCWWMNLKSEYDRAYQV